MTKKVEIEFIIFEGMLYPKITENYYTCNDNGNEALQAQFTHKTPEVVYPGGKVQARIFLEFWANGHLKEVRANGVKTPTHSHKRTFYNLFRSLSQSVVTFLRR